MNADDVARLRSPNKRTSPAFRCASCDRTPDCPMLHDEIWADVWARATKLPLECNCAAWLDYHQNCAAWLDYHQARRLGKPVTASTMGHLRSCALVKGRAEILCMVCVEKWLGRLITLDDLMPCPGNTATFVIASRAVGGWGPHRVEVPRSGGVSLAEFEDNVKRAAEEPG